MGVPKKALPQSFPEGTIQKTAPISVKFECFQTNLCFCHPLTGLTEHTDYYYTSHSNMLQRRGAQCHLTCTGLIQERVQEGSRQQSQGSGVKGQEGDLPFLFYLPSGPSLLFNVWHIEGETQGLPHAK